MSLLQEALSKVKLGIVLEEELLLLGLSWAGSANKNWQRNYVFSKP
jgi:hypothetical protein